MHTFLPFHLNADFYPHSDRKSLLWDGNDSVKQQWNAAILQTEQTALPYILQDLRSDGAAALYAFAHACLTAPQQAGQGHVGKWTQQGAQTVRKAFRELPLLLSERADWISQDRMVLPLYPLELPLHLQQRIEE